MYSIHLEQSTAYAVSRVRKTKLLYFDRLRGVWLQGTRWDTAQAGRHALDRQRRQRHHRPALQQAQRTLRRFLATSLRAGAAGRMTQSPKSDVRPLLPSPALALLRDDVSRLSACRPASVNRHDVSGNSRRSFRAQKDDRLRNFLRLAPAALRD